MSQADDLALLARWRGGDRDAGNDILARYFDGVYRFFRGKVPDEADELTQQTFTNCVKHREAVCKATSFRAYLFSIARRQLHQHLERKIRDDGRSLDLSVSAILDITESPTSVAAASEEQRLLLRALRGIPLDLQILLELHYWEQMTTAELAEALEIPQGTVKTRLRRARALLKEQMEAAATSPGLLHSTTSDLEGWARALRDSMGPAGDGP